jgi:hypothetical protein
LTSRTPSVTNDPLPPYAKALDPAFGLGRQSPPSRLAIVESPLEAGLLGQTPVQAVRSKKGGWRATQALLVLNSGHDSSRAPLLPEEQYKSVALHELGHALGLDHSCQPGQGSDNWAGCGALVAGHPYRKAVMYPTLTAETTLRRDGSVDRREYELKEWLESNDRMRAYCAHAD